MEWAPGTRVYTPCDEWEGAKNSAGYGVWKGPRPERLSLLVHRLVWMQNHGHIGREIVVMHLCDNPACVNIEHLRAGSHADNVADRDAKGRNGFASRQFCKRGHSLSGDNLYEIPSGGRSCRACQQVRSASFERSRRRSRLQTYGHLLAAANDD